MAQDRIEPEAELLELHQEVDFKGGLWLCRVSLLLAGRRRDGLGWGDSPEEAKRKALEEALALVPEAAPLLGGLCKKLPPRVSEEPSTKAESPGEGGERKDSPRVSAGDYFRKLAETLKREKPALFYGFLEWAGLDEEELKRYAAPRNNEEVAVAQKLYRAMRSLLAGRSLEQVKAEVKLERKG